MGVRCGCLYERRVSTISRLLLLGRERVLVVSRRGAYPSSAPHLNDGYVGVSDEVSIVEVQDQGRIVMGTFMAVCKM